MSTPAQTKRTPAPCTQTELLETADVPLTIAQHDTVSNVEQSDFDKEINDQLERCRKIAMITKKTSSYKDLPTTMVKLFVGEILVATLKQVDDAYVASGSVCTVHSTGSPQPRVL